jgi:hypothetical protein
VGDEKEMNTNLLNVVKQIIAEQGEAILGDPARLRPFIKDYGQNVPQDERRAFGRCIETGAYTGLKKARTQDERREVKAAFLPHIQAASGLPALQCRDALDVLEAAMFGIASPAAAPRVQTASAPRNTPPVSAPPQYQQPQYTPPPYAGPAKGHAPRNALILVLALALIAALAALAYKNTSPWRGFADFDSLARAAKFEEALGEPLTEEEFKAVMSLASLASLISDEIRFDTVSGEQLTERYGVSRTLREKYNYLVKSVYTNDPTSRIAYFNDGKWVVLSITQQDP